MRILIAGAGYVGNALAARLLASGDDVVTLNRGDETLPGASHVRADLTLRASLSALHGAFDGVAYTVGPDDGTDAGYERAYITGLRNLLESDALTASARANGGPRVLLTTSTAVYGQTSGEWVDETSETTPLDFRGARLLESERLVRAWSSKTTSVRLGGIYGPGRHRLVTSVKDGTASISEDMSGTDGPFINRLHRDDCAGLLAHLLTLTNPPQTLVGTDDEPATADTVKAFVAARLGVELRRDDSPREDGARRRGKRCRNTLLHDIGYALIYPTYREGYGAMIA